jgi:hypothetical protein
MAPTARGPRVVVTMAAIVVALAGGLGYVIGLIRPADLRPVSLLGVWTLQPTPLGLAVYGAVTVGVVLGVGILLVSLASRYDDAERT